jgi:hypothetical protein
VLDLLPAGDLILSHSHRYSDRIRRPDHRAKLKIEKEPLQTHRAITPATGVIDYSTGYFIPGYIHFHVNRRV